MKSPTTARLGTVLLSLSLHALPFGIASALPVIEVRPAALDFAVEPGDSATAQLLVTNVGDTGPLDYDIQLLDPYLPGGAPRDIGGSTFVSDPGEYAPGTEADFLLSVTNASEDYEWLTEIRLAFPSTVTVVHSTNFIGGSGGILLSNYATGPGVTLIWSDENGGWGNVYGGETVQAIVTLAFDADLAGDLDLPWRLTGDGYGGAPHQVSDKLTLAGPVVEAIDVLEPVGGEAWALGTTQRVRWYCGGGVQTVDIALSRDLGSSWETLATDVPAYDWEYEWIVTAPLSSRCRMRVSNGGGLGQGESPDDFYIYRPVDWLELSSAQGQLLPGETDTLTVLVDGAGFGDLPLYEALLRVDSNAENGPVEVPVTAGLLPTGAESAPAAGLALAAWPNPFNPSTRIAFELPRAGRARLVLHDVHGRRVARLLDAPLAAGPHALQWDGRDDAGRELPSGVYLLSLEAAGRREGGKLLLLR